MCVGGGGEGVLYLIVLVPDHCLSFYFLWPSGHNASVHWLQANCILGTAYGLSYPCCLIRFTERVFYERLSICGCSSFPFGFEGGM